MVHELCKCIIGSADGHGCVSREILAASHKAWIFVSASREGFAFLCVEVCVGVSYMHRVHLWKVVSWLGTL